MSFQTLGLSQALLDAVSKKGYVTPSPIQLEAIPQILQGRDVLASSKTGSGKTAGFVLPLLDILSKGKRSPFPRALILTPTRELADQVASNVRQYGKFLRLNSCLIYGGVSQHPQVSQLKQGTDILIATPGRLLDLHQQGFVSLSHIQMVVLDEADRMLDMGFSKDINRIMDLIPTQKQTLLFSATFSPVIKELANKILHEPVQIEVQADHSQEASQINQTLYRVNKEQKTQMLLHLIQEGNWQQALVFTSTKHGANKLCGKMLDAGITSACIHGDKTQAARNKALSNLKTSKVRILVATDVAARGLDVPLLPYVVNFELPNLSENYVHRIGRTGRAGASGEAISFVSHDEYKYLREIEKTIGKKIELQVMEGFEPQAPNHTPSFDRPHRGYTGEHRHSKRHHSTWGDRRR